MKITHRKITAHEDIPADEPKKKPVKAAVDTGLDYWYFTRHGMGPGTIPKDVQVLDWYEEGYDTWMKLDKMLTTEELNEYDIQEQFPPKGAVTHNGEEVNACDSIKAADEEVPYFHEFDGNVQEPKASELVRFRNRFYGDYLDSYDQESVLNGWCFCVGREDDEEGLYWRSFTPENWELVKDMSDEEIYKKYPEAPLRDDFAASTDVKASDVKKIKETDDTIEYVVSSNEPFVVDYDLSKLDDAWFAKQARKHKAMELADEADAYDLEHKEGRYQDVEGMSLINYKDYRIMPDVELGAWKVMNQDRDVVKRGLASEFDAKDYIDSIASSTEVEGSSSIKISDIDLDALKKEIEEGCIDYLCGPEGGFKRPGEPREDKWDMFADEMFVVEVQYQPDEYRIMVEVRAELGYESMENMSMIIDPIIQNYDSDAYFEMVEPGIMDAYIYDPDAPEEDWDDIYSSEDIEASVNEVPDRELDPPDYEEPEEKDDIKLDFDFDITVVVEDTGDWYVLDGDPLYHADLGLIEEADKDEADVVEDFRDVLSWHVPANAGKYQIKGHMTLTYEYDYGMLDAYTFAAYNSSATDVEIVNKGKVESSTDIKAVMTEEDLDYAIENNKPFDLESFKKWKTPIDPSAVLAEDVKVGDVINVDEDASEVNLGTVVKILSINDPAESWIDYTFECEVVVDPGGMQDMYVGATIWLHFSEGDPVGHYYHVVKE